MNKVMPILLLAFMVLSPTLGHSIESRNLTNSQKSELNKIVDAVTDLFKGNYDEGCGSNKHRMGTTSNRTEMDKGMMEILDGLYTNGYFQNGTEIQTWTDTYFKLRSHNQWNYRRIRYNDSDGDTDYHDGNIPSGCNRKSRWKHMYKEYAKSLRDFLKGRQIKCANEGDIATVMQCCDFDENNPLSPTPLPFLGYESPPAPNSCKLPGATCSQHSECCSEQCMITDDSGSGTGTCAPVLSCYVRVEKDNECHPITKPYCVTPWNTGGWNNKQYDVMCVAVDHQSVGIGECKQITQACTSDTECCSDKCTAGACDFNNQCQACLINGEPYIEADGIPCCPGLYQGMGDNPKCLPKFPPLVLPTAKIKVKKKSIFEKIFDLIIPSAHAVQSCNFLNEAQMLDIQGKTEDCFNEPEDGEDGINLCLQTVTQLKAAYKTTNFTTENGILQQAILECGTDISCKDEAREVFHQKCQSFSYTRMEHAQSYNIPSLQSKTTSDLNTCKFNNMNDAWAASSNDERNAELVVRAFEFLFSGGGAQDFWVQSNRDGKNLFMRSKHVATLLKRMRKQTRQIHQERDTLMMCKCVLAKKGEGVPEEVMSFFNVAPECEQDKIALDKILTNINTSQAIGAAGITHEAFLVSYSEIKRDTAIDEFFDYTEVNTELDALVGYLNGDEANSADWYKADIGFTKIYSFKVKWMSTWFKIFLIVLAIGLVLALVVASAGSLGIFGATMASAIGSLGSTVGPLVGITVFTSLTQVAAIGITTIMLASALVGAGISALFKNRIAKPKIRDVVVESKNNSAAYDEDAGEYDWGQGKKWNWLGTHKYFKIDRYYDYPYYNDSLSNCYIMASANMCVRNMFLSVSDHGLSYLTDAKKPLFVGDFAYPDDTNYVGMINASHQYLITKLVATNPGSVTKRKFLKRHILSEPDIQRAMMPLNGSYVPDAFDEQKVMRVYEATKKFARCKELTGPLATAECRVNVGDYSVEEGDIGFGYFFESQADIDDFAAYFYQHHFHWPSLTASGQIGYPLLGQNIYYQTILHNVRIIMAGAKSRSNLFGDLYDLYKADWDKRIKDYDCSTGVVGEGESAACAVITAGGFSQNVNYSETFLKKFRRLNFTMGQADGVIASGDSQLNISGSGNNSGLSESEVRKLDSASKQALKNAEQRAKAAHYKKIVGDTPRGKQIQKAFDKWNTKFSKPMAAMDMEKSGKKWGGTQSISNVKNNYNSIKKDLDKKIKVDSSNSGYSSSYDKYSSNNYGNSNRYGSSSSGSNSSTLPDLKTKEEKVKTPEEILADKNASYGFLNRDESDSIFQIVSKAYGRNLDRFLVKEPVKLDIKEPGKLKK